MRIRDLGMERRLFPAWLLLYSHGQGAGRWIASCSAGTERVDCIHLSSLQSCFTKTSRASPTLLAASITCDSFASGLNSLSGNGSMWLFTKESTCSIAPSEPSPHQQTPYAFPRSMQVAQNTLDWGCFSEHVLSASRRCLWIRARW